MDILFALIFGIIAGGVVNLLADELPYRRNPGLPTYADGTPRPPTAWLGITAFLLGQRRPQPPAPDENCARPHQQRDKLTWRYPLIEALTVALMLLVAFDGRTSEDMTAVQLGLNMLYMAILALILVIDVEHRLVLRVVTYPAIALALVDALLLPVPDPNLVEALAGAGLGFGVFFIMYLGGILFLRVINRGRSEENKVNEVPFGFGDVLLITFSGAVLGFGHIIFAMFIAVFLGAIGALLYLVVRFVQTRRFEAYAAIPYGPYIIAATALMILHGNAVQRAIVGWP